MSREISTLCIMNKFVSWSKSAGLAGDRLAVVSCAGVSL